MIKIFDHICCSFLTKPNIYQITQRTWAARSKSQTQLQETSIFWGFLICQKSFGATNFKMKWELLKNWHDPWKSCWISLKWFLSCGKSIMYLTSSTWPGEGKLENGTVWDVLHCTTSDIAFNENRQFQNCWAVLLNICSSPFDLEVYPYLCSHAELPSQNGAF